MNTNRKRVETFKAEGGFLIREVVPRRGKKYIHRCELETLEEVAYAIDDLVDAGFTLDPLALKLDLPHTQVAVALAFLKERGIVDTRFRVNYSGTRIGVHCDAMTEYWALDASALA